MIIAAWLLLAIVVSVCRRWDRTWAAADDQLW